MTTSNSSQASLEHLFRISAKLLCAGLFILHLITVFLISPGYMSIDEGSYHMMAHNFAEHHDLEIRNGYEEFPSDSLEIKTWTAKPIKVIHGKLVPQYPYLYPVLNYPFYKLFGYRGLYVLNTLCFWLVLLVTWKLTRRLTNDASTAWLASILLGLGSFLFEYSLATMPHVTMVLILTLSFYHMIIAYLDDKRLHAMACGLFWGLSLGIRYDSILLAPLIFMPFLFCWKVRWQRVGDLIIGCLPGFLLLLWTNYLKFGVIALLSYGTQAGLKRYIPLMIIFLVGSVSIWLITRRKPSLYLWERRRYWWAILPVLIFAMFVPKVRSYVFQLVEGCYLMGINLTSAGLRKNELLLNLATPQGAITYIGGIKKALLQSAPYLACLLLPLLQILRNPKEKLLNIYLMGPVLLFVAFFGFFSWHGGLSLNMRYLLPVFPFAAILAAQVLRPLMKHRMILAGGLLLGIVGFMTVRILNTDPHVIYLYIPLVIMGLTALASVLVFAKPDLSFPLAFLIPIGLAWAALTTFSYDTPMVGKRRAFTYTSGMVVSQSIKPDSMLFVDSFDPYFPVIENKVRMARPTMNDFKDFAQLANYHLQHGRPVYAAFRNQTLARARTEGFLQGFTTKMIKRLGASSLVEIKRAETSAANQ